MVELAASCGSIWSPAGAWPACSDSEIADQGPLLFQQPLGFAMLQPQPLLIGLVQAAVFANQPAAFDGPGDEPEQVANGGGVDANIGVGPHFVA